MPTYPLWKPGDKRPSDRLLIFEDEDHDGRADRCKVFYDKLHCPTGFEFWNGGVLVTDQPRLIWLKDTDGDDKADVVVDLLDGWASDDTHHTIGAFEYSNGGLLHMLEGVAMSTTVETPWGPHRRHDAAGAHVLDPRTLKLSHFVTPGYGNPWCYVFDSWGQGIRGRRHDSAQQHWDSPLSGEEVAGRRGMDPIFNNQGMRPCVGSEFLLSRQFPDERAGPVHLRLRHQHERHAAVQHSRSVGRLRGRTHHAAAGERRKGRQATAGRPARQHRQELPPRRSANWAGWRTVVRRLVQRRSSATCSTRSAIRTATTSAAAFTGWCTRRTNCSSQSRSTARRKPNCSINCASTSRARDTGRGASCAIGRRTLCWPQSVNGWPGLIRTIPSTIACRCEALWAQQGHHAVDEKLLGEVLAAKTPNARAAAMHVVADERDYLPNALDLLRAGVRDEHPRVRLEAIRGLSFFQSPSAVDGGARRAGIADRFVDRLHAGAHACRARAAVERRVSSRHSWPPATSARKNSSTTYLQRRAPGLAAQGRAQEACLTPKLQRRCATKAYARLEAMHGDAKNGRAVFGRLCASCHKLGDIGYTFGPDQSDVGKRLNRHEIVESIIEPSKKVDPKYVTTTLITTEGKSMVGFIVAKKKDSITLLMAEGKQATIATDDIDEMAATNQSSMPENLASTLSPSEFLDIVEFLGTCK